MRSTMPLPAKKKRSRSTRESGPQPNLLVHQGPPPHRQDRPILPAAPAPLGGAAKLMDGKVNGLYKTEVIRRRGPWRSLEAVEFATLEWVDWFNHRRLLEPIGNIPPAAAEARYYAQIAGQAMAA